jgi:hypothetical protein
MQQKIERKPRGALQKIMQARGKVWFYLLAPKELLLLTKAYMKVSCNAKHGTDKKSRQVLG